MTAGKLLRFATTTTAGIIEPISGGVLGLVDSFLINKILKKDKAIAFINKMYPSLYDK